MKYASTTERQEKQSALYETWLRMMRQARKESQWFEKLKLKDVQRVDSAFADFSAFRLWAVFECGYDQTKDNQKVIARKDPHAPFSPGNCFFSDHVLAEIPAEFADKEPDKSSAGASRVTYSQNGICNTRLYDIWKGMIRRCTSEKCKDYPDYGGRGITVCQEWRDDFKTFYNWAWDHGYSPCLSLERIDVNGGYCPGNCRWAGDLEQQMNRRALNGMYSNVRLKVSDMRRLLNEIHDEAVVTLVVRTTYLPDYRIEQADYPPIPMEDRIDVKRSK